MSHSTPATKFLDKLKVAYTLHNYDYDPDPGRGHDHQNHQDWVDRQTPCRHQVRGHRSRQVRRCRRGSRATGRGLQLRRASRASRGGRPARDAPSG